MDSAFLVAIYDKSVHYSAKDCKFNLLCSALDAKIGLEQDGMHTFERVFLCYRANPSRRHPQLPMEFRWEAKLAASGP